MEAQLRNRAWSIHAHTSPRRSRLAHRPSRSVPRGGGIARQFAPECSGPDYGMTSEEERKQMRRRRDMANDFAAALLKEAEG